MIGERHPARRHPNGGIRIEQVVVAGTVEDRGVVGECPETAVVLGKCYRATGFLHLTELLVGVVTVVRRMVIKIDRGADG